MFFIHLISRLPFSVLYFISDIIFVLSYYVIGYRKKVVTENIHNSFPELNDSEKRVIIKNFYKNLSDIIVETVKALTITESELKKRATVINPEILKEPHEKGKSIVVATVHQCNWEWLLLACSIQTPYDIDAVYKHIKNDFSRKLVLGIRKKFGAYMMEKSRVNRELILRKNKLRIIALVGDQSPAVAADSYWTTFLHQKTAFYKGIEKISGMMQIPVYFSYMKRVKRGYYIIEFLKLDPNENEGRILDTYASMTEKVIRANPSDWLWSHKRWKNKFVEED